MSAISLQRLADHDRPSVQPTGSLLKRLSRLWARRRTAAILGRLSDRDLHDIGLRRDQIPDLATREGWDALLPARHHR